ncbi:Glyoxylate/hydroxypyruvate reductase HPR3 [Linum perenne]
MSSPEDPRPPVLLLKCPPSFQRIGEEHFTSNKFRYLKSYESPLPLDGFLLTTHAQSVRAILSTGKFPIPAETLQLLPNVRAIVTTGAGLNHLDLPECRRRGIKIANAGDVFSADGADYAVGLLIDVFRRISAGDRYVKDGFWASTGDCRLGSRVSGKRIGIVGLGRIGHQVAKRLEPFRCNISYTSRNPKPNVSYQYYDNVLEMASNCDVLILTCGLTELTWHMINDKVMDALGKEGVIINVARGAVVDEEELVRRLIGGELAGAGLDVFENEPDVPEQLKELDNVVLSPHCGIASYEAMVELSRLVVGNLEAFFEGRPLLSEYLDD